MNTTVEWKSTPPMIATSGDIAMVSQQPSWYALWTRARAEKKIAAELNQSGFELFMPLVDEVHRWSDRRKVIQVPLLSCYVFLRAVLSPQVRRSMLRTCGVLQFVTFSGEPAPIPDHEIENLRLLLQQNVPLSPHGFLKAGQRVRIRGGALEGVEGILLAWKRDRKLIVSVNLIQRSLALSLDGYDIEPA